MGLAAENSIKLSEYAAAATNYVNQIRAYLGLDALDAVPKGKRGEANSCPVARGVCQGSKYAAVVTGVRTYILPVGPHNFSPLSEYPIPGDVQRFIELFDNGFYINLVE